MEKGSREAACILCSLLKIEVIGVGTSSSRRPDFSTGMGVPWTVGCNRAFLELLSGCLIAVAGKNAKRLKLSLPVGVAFRHCQASHPASEQTVMNRPCESSKLFYLLLYNLWKLLGVSCLWLNIPHLGLLCICLAKQSFIPVGSTITDPGNLGHGKGHRHRQH